MDVKEFFKNIKEYKPLVHHITNYVTVNDCANITLAIGASPIMTANLEELEDILKISSSLVLNIGTMDKVEAFIEAPKVANKLNVPIILDPVGAGASKKRNDLLKTILSESKFDVIKGNVSEIISIAGIGNSTQGVDISEKHKNLKPEQIIEICEGLSHKLNCVIAVTGQNDIVVYKNKNCIISNGVEYMSKITGTGCMTSSLIGSFIASNNDKFLSTICAITTMGICGEIAFKNLENDGIYSFRNKLMDNVSNFKIETFNKYSKIKINMQ